MILSSKALKEALAGEWVCNKNVRDLNFGPNSVDVTLSHNFLYPRSLNKPLDPTKYNDDLFIKVNANSIIIHPGEFILGSVNEAFDCTAPLLWKTLHDDLINRYYIPMYEGRSTMARMGIQSHCSAGFGDYGFKGAFTLEISNLSPWDVVLTSGMRIGQVYFVETDKGVVGNEYKGYDQSDCEPQVPRIGLGRF